MKRYISALLFLAFAFPIATAFAQDKKDPPITDSRLGSLKTLNDYFPFTPPKTKAEWEQRRKELKEQVKVALGLWPMPKKTPLNATIHGAIKRDGYTIEKVFFESYPGFYVTGNLYRPTAKPKNGKAYPGVLCPHGHWRNGRFYDAGEKAAKAQIKQGAEETMAGARYPLQARCAQLARMGCVVFHYDMIGYADSKQTPHRVGFTDAEAELWLQNFMGLQTWNSIRALDFLLSLKDVDKSRIGVTGASGGGTQTFILCAVDDRPDVAFPAVMVSTAMQGGCICENASYLRVDTGNIELAALFAPRPLGMSGADDWTKEIETKGYPELQHIYQLYNARDRVLAKAFTKFKHNYNQVSREVMYNFFNKHLKLGLKSPVKEQQFEPVPPEQLSVFDDEHPMPKNAVKILELRNYMTRESQKQLKSLFPSSKKSLAEFNQVVGTGLRVMVNDSLPSPKDVHMRKDSGQSKRGLEAIISRKGEEEAIHEILVLKDFNKVNQVVVWIHPKGIKSLWGPNGKLVPAAQKILDKNAAIIAADVFGVGELALDKPIPIDKRYAGYTFGYNRSLLANRVHDILTVCAKALDSTTPMKIHLVGFEEAGPWVVMARGLCGDKIARTAADLNQFRFENILSVHDEMMIPGALKYGGIPAFAALAAPHEMFLHNAKGTDVESWTEAAYGAAGRPGNLRVQDDQVNATQVVDWLLR